MTAAKLRPDWAPDDCPQQVIQLLEHEQFLQNLGVRGLASADSQEVRTAVHRLKFAIDEAMRLGFRRGLPIGLGVGAALGAIAAYVAFGG